MERNGRAEDAFRAAHEMHNCVTDLARNIDAMDQETWAYVHESLSLLQVMIRLYLENFDERTTH